MNLQIINKGGQATFFNLAITVSVKNATNKYITDKTLFFALTVMFGSTKNVQGLTSSKKRITKQKLDTQSMILGLSLTICYSKV